MVQYGAKRIGRLDNDGLGKTSTQCQDVRGQLKKKSKKKLWLYDRKKVWLLNGSLSIEQCTECKGPLLYFEEYDAVCCPRCNTWRDPKCSDANCSFCPRRPEKPDMGLREFPVDKKSLFVEKYSHKLKRKESRELRNHVEFHVKERQS